MVNDFFICLLISEENKCLIMNRILTEHEIRQHTYERL